MDFTDASGHTKYLLADETTPVDLGISANGIGSGTVKVKIVFDNAAGLTNEQIQAEWGANNDGWKLEHYYVVITPSNGVKVAASQQTGTGDDSSKHWVNTSANAAMELSFDTRSPSFTQVGETTNYAWESAAQTVYYGFEGTSSVQTRIQDGSIVLSSSKTTTLG